MTEACPRHVLFLLSSARRDGNSAALARRAAAALGAACRFVDLAAAPLPAFTDTRPAPPPPPDPALQGWIDDLRAASDICFVAPVYWYALPAPAKLLLDHWSGLLDRPELGFAAMMAGKRLWLITTRADPDPTVADLPEAMLRRTAQWLGMHWGGALHGVADAPGEIEQDAAWDRAAGFLTGIPA